MKISNNNGFETYPVGLNEISSTSKITKQEEIKSVLPNTQPTQDTVSLSEDAKYHAMAKIEALETADVRADKVQRLKAMIANGTYEFNSMDTAKAIVKDLFAHRELLLVN
ncbi:MAG: flagellar biosynthesis anti-sigma factor FlgM [Mailhella sp.]|nr:flagellar biosynthesis anti-sigma factor FlgM [Mailhella sp.]